MSTLLSCERLISNLCEIGDYVIEWRLNSTTGTIVFISGKGTDPAIQAQHPFYDEVVFAGTLYPIIRYAYINGDKYTAYYEEGAYYSPDFITCLSPVVIDAVDCSTVLGTDPLYPYDLVYNNEHDTGVDKSRIIKFDISSDTTYLAWEFTPYAVSEQLQIYYCTAGGVSETLIDNFVMGARNASGGTLVTNLYPSNYPTNYRTYNPTNYSSILKFITDISTFIYAPGNYLKIKIVGSVLEPSITNTNWEIKLKCLTDDDIDDSFYDTSISKITDTPIMAYTGDPNCYYNVSYNTLTAPGPQNKITSPYFLYKYTQLLTSLSYNPAPNSSFVNPVNSGVRWNSQTGSVVAWSGPNYSICTNLSGGQTISISKDSSNCVFTFTDVVDYNLCASEIASIQANSAYTAYLASTPTDIAYYSCYQVKYIYATSTCGDALHPYYLYFHFGCTVVLDPVAKTITFTYSTPSNGLINEECNSSYETVGSMCTAFINTKNLTINPLYTTSPIRDGCPISALKLLSTVLHETYRVHYEYFYIENVFLNGIFDLSTLGGNPWFCLDGTQWKLYRSYDWLTLTQYSTHDERMNCWNLKRRKGLRTNVCSDYSIWETIYTAPCTTTTTTLFTTTTTTTI